jgi:hypothetical protein
MVTTKIYLKILNGGNGFKKKILNDDDNDNHFKLKINNIVTIYK